MNVEAIPAELRALPQWIVWRVEERDGKQTKVPYQIDGSYARTNDPSTWTTFAMVSYATGFAGIGFVLTPNDPYVGIDLDTWNSETAAIVSALDSYTERSISGRGVHIFVRANLNGTTRRRHGPIEVYERERFFVVTGEHMRGTPLTIEERQDELGEIMARYLPKPAVRQAAPASEIPVSDAELLKRAFAASNGPDLERLYRGDWEGGYNSASEADLALCGHLAFWASGDHARIDRIFRGSGLMRPKWDERRGEQTYGDRTIAEALRGRVEFYDPERRPSPGRVKTAPNSGAPKLIYAESIQTRPITFLDGTYRFPLGTVTMLAGDGGLGKSLLMAREAAIVSQRGDGVIFLSAEDDPATVWVPRLKAQEADLSRVAILRVERHYEDLTWDESPTIPGELPRLRLAIQKMNARLSPNQVKLVVIDPLEAHLDDGRDDGNSSVARRRALSPLDALAGEHELVASVLHHISKDSSQRARYRVLGTSANRNAVRSLLFFAANPDEEVGEGEEGVERIEFHEKHNLSPRNPARKYVIETVDVDGVAVPRLGYLGETKVDIERLMGIPASHEEKTERDETRDFLLEAVENGPRPSAELMREAVKNLGVSEKTVRRAFKDGNLVKRRVDREGKHYWEWDKPPRLQLIQGGMDTDVGHVGQGDDQVVHHDPEEDAQGGMLDNLPDPGKLSNMTIMDCPRCGPREPKTIIAGFAYCACGEKVRWE